MDDFISEDELLTFEGWLRYQCVDFAALPPEEQKIWRDIFDDTRRRCEATPKVGLMKLQPVPGEQKYAVAIRKGSDLWLTLWVRCSPKGDVYIMYPRGDRDWQAHASYHRNGTFHQKSYGHLMDAPQKRQPLTGAFKGTEHLGHYAGHGTTNGAVCDPTAFTGVVIVEPRVLGPRTGFVAVDLVEPGCDLTPLFGTQIIREVFPRDPQPSVVITIGQQEPLPVEVKREDS